MFSIFQYRPSVFFPGKKSQKNETVSVEKNVSASKQIRNLQLSRQIGKSLHGNLGAVAEMRKSKS
ncbi:hypothetical protein LEP1GSC193_1459 [Leptospira alstonii serovar Pingchang str. 80-412]|uniref:Uncharacterized protein n=2 Tax=Leptospira alstonii TaxID=28452 RepID=M6CU16_9LEPT|nr:hypothetical protein LEP1GSC194_1510 [Leptospira alstonii serovar Sichuan str. 79601]EQA81841.1 hypothetical protein LEP1GSC193_1459 [Leptospira alstonii serovar Pingchang str. 80-412]